MAEAKPRLTNLRLIETDAFPIEFLSKVAQRESWRKEINRPLYHLHKWWATRLGSVFRGIILGCVLGPEALLQDAFYEKSDKREVTIFDPFMGSGTTVGEAHKLGCTAIGRDINPVPCESVRIAFGPLDRVRLKNAFEDLSSTVGERIRSLYVAEDDQGQPCEVLYYFWVKVVNCSQCGAGVDLFSDYVFARNAYPHRKPEVHIYCPNCQEIFAGLNHVERTECPVCGFAFNPHAAPANRLAAKCQNCRNEFSIIQAIRESGRAPHHRMYAKLVLLSDGTKKYLRASERDLEEYAECSGRLRDELEIGAIRLPHTNLSDGHNTRQAIGYNYREWRQFFNDRQLLALGWLQDSIACLRDPSSRDALLLLFSGLLEFNNLFATYKGEGTGAVRHMFSHHILKPERLPLEANVWGTTKSSGSFSNLFKQRLARLLDYRESPFELTPDGSGKSFYASPPFSGHVDCKWPPTFPLEARGIFISCGSSETTQLADKSIDFVVTDPPFFDNVHYSELADFFYSWQILYPRGFVHNGSSTRNPGEVQDTDPTSFAEKLRRVFAECHRVLKDDGLLVFTYHHSRVEGWTSVAEAIFGAGFSVRKVHPVRSEMSVAAPKTQAQEPIQFDIIVVCRKRESDDRVPIETELAFAQSQARAETLIRHLELCGFKLSSNDRKIIIAGELLCELGPVNLSDAVLGAIRSHIRKLGEPRLNSRSGTDKVLLE